MLQRINIKNFRSLKDVTVDLQQVNLLIGPNNSGKTNFFKAFEFLSTFYNNRQLSQESYSRNYFGFWEPISLKNNRKPISFTFSFKLDEDRYGIYILEIFGASDTSLPIYRELYGISKNDISEIRFDTIKQNLNSFYSLDIHVFNASIDKVCRDVGIKVPIGNKFILHLQDNKKLTTYNETMSGIDFIKSFNDLHSCFLVDVFQKVVIYQPDTNKLQLPGRLGDENYLENNAVNMVSFLDNMRDQNPEIYERIKLDLNECLNEFNDIRFKKVKNNGTYDKKIGLIDNRGKIFWAEELSEGTLYFLALLSIIHQPNPTKLLLLEEPEKGIHPRRIHEVMEYIFRLAEEKGIQIILTTHNTQLVDEFEDSPQSVFIFEMINGETEIKNLLTGVIEPANEKSEEKGLPFIKYTELLGEKWFQGFIGGVP